MAGSGAPLPYPDDNRQTGIIVTAITVSIFASIVVALRLATRIWIVRNVGIDDYTIIAATLGTIIGCGLDIVEVHYGFGRHKAYLSTSQFTEVSKFSYGEWIQTFQTLIVTKLSICFFLLRIPVERFFIRPIQGAIGFLLVSNIILTLLWTFQCNPVHGAWNKDAPAKCFSEAQLQRIIISQAIISILSDVALALFPIALLWKVQIALRIKAGLCALMALGLITAACCIVRTIMNWQNVNGDPTWASIDNWYWRSLEVCIGIVAASIPALRPGYKTISAGVSSYMTRRTTRKANSSTLDNSGHPFDHLSDKDPIARDKAVFSDKATNPLGAAAHSARVEADRAAKYGVGEEGFAMKSLPGDKRTSVDQGIRKTTQFDVEIGSHESLGSEDVEKGEGGKYFA